MAERKKVTMELTDEEAGYLVIELTGLRIQKRHERAEKVAAKYFNPGKLKQLQKYSQLVNDIRVLMDNPDIDIDDDSD